MGQSTEEPSKVNSSMKMFVVLALAAVAVAEPEADPALVYSSLSGLTHPYSGLTYPYSGLIRPYAGLTHSYSGLTHPYTALSHGYYNPLVYKTPGAHIINKREAEADPALFYSGVLPSTYTAGRPLVYNPLTYRAPFAPVVSTYSHSALPVTSYTTHSVAAPTQVVSNYEAPDHYTADATPLGKALGVPSYVSKNGELEHVVEKREAEADPAVVYSGVLPTTYSHGVLPTTYTHGVAPAVTYNHHVPTYTNIYNRHVPVSYAGVYNAAPAVAATHPSNVGLCFNNE